MIKRCIVCNKDKNYIIRFNSMETYMQFRVKKKLKKNVNNGFVCLDCREQLRKGLEEESGIKIN